MRIDHNPFGLLEADAQDNIGRFACRPGDGDQFGKSLRDLASKLCDDLAGRTLDRFGLVVKEAGCADESFEFRQRGFGHGGRGREAAEQLRRDHVHTDIRALGGEDGRDKQFPRRGVRQGALNFRIGFVESLENSGDAVGGQIATRPALWRRRIG